MLETRQVEPIQPKKATVADKAISWMVDSWQKIKPPEKSFSERRNLLKQASDEVLVLEKDLPVVQEALQVGQENRAAGTLISRELNPLGQKISDLTLMIFGDSHIPGSERKESPYELNEKPYRIFKKIRLFLLGVQETLSKKTGQSFSREATGFDFQNFEEKTDFFDGVDDFQAFAALETSFARKAKELRPSLTPESQVLVVNVGDNSDGHDKMGDIALSTLNLNTLRDEVAQAAEVPTMMTHLKGNHDTDLNNHSLEHDQFHRELFGEQIFLQEVGKDLLILSINTNFYSTFWHEHLQRRKQKGLTEQDQRILENIHAEMVKQKKLVEMAVASGKKLIFIGHERGYMQQALGMPWEQSNVIAVVSGHTHKHENFEGKNKNGEVVHFLNVGASQKIQVDGEKKRVLSGFALRIKNSDQGPAVSIDEIIPNAQDYQEVEFDMYGGR